jgi:ATP-binding cassette subfamily F protein 3
VRVREERRAAGEDLQGPVLNGGSKAAPAREIAVNGSATKATGAKPKVKSTPKAKPKADGPSKNRLRDQQKAERAVEEAEVAMRAIEDELADPAQWASKYEAAKSEARHTAAKRAVEQAYERLEALQT